MKELVIISGITGALGNSLLAQYGRKRNTIVYGISRQAENIKSFINPNTKKLYLSTLIFSLQKFDKRNYDSFVDLINFPKFSKVIYIHSLGHYPFELNKKGEHFVRNDKDGDGIDDLCQFLSYDVFSFMVSKLLNSTKLPLQISVFGGLADKHKPLVHRSWWKTFEKTKDYMKSINKKNVGRHVFNISSVLCTHELTTRPYVFIKTDANPRFWLSPEEVSKKVVRKLRKNKTGYFEHEIFHVKPNFDKEYYVDKKFTPRKISELFE